jgi:hypothetical protein
VRDDAPTFGNDPRNRNRERLFDDDFDAAGKQQDERAGHSSRAILEAKLSGAKLPKLDEIPHGIAQELQAEKDAAEAALADGNIEQAEALLASYESNARYWEDLSKGRIDEDGQRIVQRSGAAESHGSHLSGPGVRPPDRESDPNVLIRRQINARRQGLS